MRSCRVCGLVKSLAQFSPSNRANGYRGNCKPCGVKLANEHRKRIVAARKEGHLGRLVSKRCGRCKKLLPAQSFGLNDYVRSGLSPYCKPCSKTIRSEHRESNLAAYLLRSARRRAKLKGLRFDLLISDITIPVFCPVLGTQIVSGTRAGNPHSASIDRIDNSKGYVADNIIIVSRRANTIKNDATPAELRKVAEFYSALRGGTRG